MQKRWFRPRLLGAGLGCSVALFAWPGCRKAEVPTRVPTTPSVRLYFMSTVAGALEPCGCRKDMLGGIDHAAALLDAESKSAPHRLLLAVGPTFFQDPELEPERREQDLWKAEALATSLADVELGAWAPGTNDFAAGTAVLRGLAESSKARMLAANLPPGELPIAATALFDVGGYKVGVAGLGAAGPSPPSAGDPAGALAAAAQTLSDSGAQIKVALIAAGRGDGLRLAERVAGFDVVALGKPTESGEANDALFPPTLVGETLVVQAPNHLQALAYVDLFVSGDDFAFRDGTGIADAERRQSLTSRIEEVEQRMARWVREQKPDPEQVRLREADIAKLKTELVELDKKSKAAAEPQGSSFRYRVLEVRETAGSDPDVAKRMSGYYRRVNEHNREAFKDRKPEPAKDGVSRYLGQASCVTCHAEAEAYWQTTSHAKAYETLTTEFKEFNLDCVSCHVTGYNRPGGSTVTHVEALQDVQCEACHGPGSRHVESSGDTSLITLVPEASVCRSCHHTPHVADDWDVATALPKILGPGHGAPSVGAAPPKP